MLNDTVFSDLSAPLVIFLGTANRVFGHIADNPVGTTYLDRKAAANAGVHRPLQGGICGGEDGAESIVVSGGYVDDQDYGDVIVYTGQGGRDPDSGRQIQTPGRPNLSGDRRGPDGRRYPHCARQEPLIPATIKAVTTSDNARRSRRAARDGACWRMTARQ